MEIGLNRMGKRVLLLCGLVLTIYLCFRFLLPLVLPFVFAAVVSVLYYPGSDTHLTLRATSRV